MRQSESESQRKTVIEIVRKTVRDRKSESESESERE